MTRRDAALVPDTSATQRRHSRFLPLIILVAAVVGIVVLVGPTVHRYVKTRGQPAPVSRTELIDGRERPCTDYGDHSWYDHEPYLDECRDAGHR